MNDIPLGRQWPPGISATPFPNSRVTGVASPTGLNVWWSPSSGQRRNRRHRNARLRVGAPLADRTNTTFASTGHIQPARPPPAPANAPAFPRTAERLASGHVPLHVPEEVMEFDEKAKTRKTTCGDCGRSSPAMRVRDDAAARQLLQATGWAVSPTATLCPRCAGGRPGTQSED